MKFICGILNWKTKKRCYQQFECMRDLLKHVSVEHYHYKSWVKVRG